MSISKGKIISWVVFFIVIAIIATTSIIIYNVK